MRDYLSSFLVNTKTAVLLAAVVRSGTVFMQTIFFIGFIDDVINVFNAVVVSNLVGKAVVPEFALLAYSDFKTVAQVVVSQTLTFIEAFQLIPLTLD